MYKKTIEVLIILSILVISIPGCVTHNSSTIPNGSSTGTIVSGTTNESLATIVGEWPLPPGIQGIASTFRGQGIYGTINSRDYLFLGAGDSQPTVINANSTAYLGRLLILDISDPLKPLEVGSIQLDNKLNVFDMTLSMDTLYVSALSCLWIIDVSDPANPREIIRYDGNQQTNQGVLATGSIIYGQYAYVNNWATKFTQIDISDPANPKIMRDLTDIPQPYLGLVRGFGHLLFDYVANGEKAGLHIIDIAQPDTVKEIGYFGTPEIAPTATQHGAIVGKITDLTVSGNYLYFDTADSEYDSSLHIISAANPTTLSEVGMIALSGNVKKIQVAGGYAYVELWNRHNDTGSIAVIDVSNPQHPVQVDSIELPTFESLFMLVDKYIYYFGGENNPIKIIRQYSSN